MQVRRLTRAFFVNVRTGKNTPFLQTVTIIFIRILATTGKIIVNRRNVLNVIDEVTAW